VPCRARHSTAQPGIIYLTPQGPSPSSSAESGDLPGSGAPEVTPAMIEAGAEALREVSSDEWAFIHRSKDQSRLSEIVTDVFARMLKAR
jgi:hypothetical protein